MMTSGDLLSLDTFVCTCGEDREGQLAKEEVVRRSDKVSSNTHRPGHGGKCTPIGFPLMSSQHATHFLGLKACTIAVEF